jgi:tetratricopeptide (TPR) repeat protein
MLRALLRSFEYDNPRAEICCQLGYYYFQNAEYEKAIFWYKLASQVRVPADSWGFISHDYYGYIPNIQLCICYDRLGNIDEAIKYNEKAAEIKPDSTAVEYNRNYFNSLKN